MYLCHVSKLVIFVSICSMFAVSLRRNIFSKRNILNMSTVKNPEIDVTPKLLNDAFTWRRACKRFGKGDKSVDIEPILEAINNAPSSYGLTPYTIYVVSRPEIQKILAPLCYNQPQITEASHLIFFAARNDSSIVCERFIQATKLDEKAPGLAGAIRGSAGAKDASDFQSYARAQSYIALGFALSACALLRIPSCPMEGFDAEAVAKIIGTKPNEKPFVCLAVGGPVPDATPYPRFRFPKDEIFKTV